MIIHVVVPLHRHSLAPEKVAEWMGHMIDPDNDVVRAVTVTDDEGDMLVWRRRELPDSLTAADLPRGVSAEQQARDLHENAADIGIHRNRDEPCPECDNATYYVGGVCAGCGYCDHCQRPG